MLACARGGQATQPDLEDSDSSTSPAVGDLAQHTLRHHHGSQEDLRLEQRRRQQRTVQRYQQGLLQSKDKKLMGQLNQSLEETKNSSAFGARQSRPPAEGSRAHQQLRSLSQASGEFRVLKESKSHDRTTMLSRLTASGVVAASGVSRLNVNNKEQYQQQQRRTLHNRHRLFNIAVGSSSAEEGREHSQTSQEAPNMENLQDVEEDNFADGRIPEANISNYNSHQSQSKLAAFQRHRGLQSYASGGSNALEETCIIQNGNNLFLRQELRNPKLPTLNDSHESSGHGLRAPLEQSGHSAGVGAAAHAGRAAEGLDRTTSLMKQI